jgi:GTP cyclohydrolase II
MMIKEIARHTLETRFGPFELASFAFGDNQQMVLALWRLDRSPLPASPEILLRIQYGCINGTVFKAVDCDCGFQVESALKRISQSNNGVFIYFADHEAFGFGLASKMEIVSIEKREGKTFFEVLESRGYPRTVSDVLWTMPQIFAAIGVPRKVILLGASEEKFNRLKELDFEVTRVDDLVIDQTELSQSVVQELQTKRSIFSTFINSIMRRSD